MLCILCPLFILSCSIENESAFLDLNQNQQVPQQNREWTILIYMSADNNLEAAAMSDIWEMETSSLDTQKVTVLFLVDRSSAFDTSNGNWSGGRLYELKTGRKNNDYSIISNQKCCSNLSLEIGTETEIDMSSRYTLQEILKYTKANYPAEHTGLIIWGHGSGWRSDNAVEESKGFSHDGTSGKSMSLIDLHKAISEGCENRKLDFVGFDTCFGGEMEVFFELKDIAEYAIGSEGLVLESGWNYKLLFDLFNISERKTVLDFCNCVKNQFMKQFENQIDASICFINLNKMNDFFNLFDSAMAQVSECIVNSRIRDEIINGIVNEVDLCSTGIEGDDVYADILSLMNYVGKFQQNGNQIMESIIELCIDIKKNSWSVNENKVGIGVYFATLGAGGLYFTSHPSYYIRGKSDNQILFVQKSGGYVPQKNKTGSFLDKLFYTTEWRE